MEDALTRRRVKRESSREMGLVCALHVLSGSEQLTVGSRSYVQDTCKPRTHHVLHSVDLFTCITVYFDKYMFDKPD